MAKITPNQDFLHGPKRYKKGTEYDVEDALALYFTFNGWTTDSPDGTSDAVVDLNVDDITQKSEVE